MFLSFTLSIFSIFLVHFFLTIYMCPHYPASQTLKHCTTVATMCKRSLLYRIVLYILSLVYFIHVLLTPYLNKDSKSLNLTIASLLLVPGMLSNLLTIRYLFQKFLYKNHCAYLWILIILTLTLDYYLRYILLLHKYLHLPSGYQYWISFIKSYFYGLRIVSVITVAFSRLSRFMMGKSVNRIIFKIIIVVLLVFIAALNSAMNGILHENKYFSNMETKTTIEGTILTSFFIMIFLCESVMAGVRYFKNVKEPSEFSFKCFSFLFVVGTYEGVVFFLVKTFAKLRYVQDDWSWFVFASYGLIMHFMDNDFKKAVQDNCRIFSREPPLHAVEYQTSL